MMNHEALTEHERVLRKKIRICAARFLRYRGVDSVPDSDSHLTTSQRARRQGGTAGKLCVGVSETVTPKHRSQLLTNI